MVAVPADTPLTLPDASTDAIAALLVLHDPPDTVSDNVVVAPTHTVDAPVITPPDGDVFTVNDVVALAAPQLPVTV